MAWLFLTSYNTTTRCANQSSILWGCGDLEKKAIMRWQGWKRFHGFVVSFGRKSIPTITSESAEKGNNLLIKNTDVLWDSSLSRVQPKLKTATNEILDEKEKTKFDLFSFDLLRLMIFIWQLQMMKRKSTNSDERAASPISNSRNEGERPSFRSVFDGWRRGMTMSDDAMADVYLLWTAAAALH